MAASEIVSDTGPLISLEKLPDGFRLLRQLFSKVFLPQEVLLELQQGYPGEDYLLDHKIQNLIEVVDAPPLELAQADRLDPGERAAIALALSMQCPLLIEERLGRQMAVAAGLKIAGAAGLLNLAFRRQILSRSEAIESLGQLFAARRIGKNLHAAMVAHLSER